MLCITNTGVKLAKTLQVSLHAKIPKAIVRRSNPVFSSHLTKLSFCYIKQVPVEALSL